MASWSQARALSTLIIVFSLINASGYARTFYFPHYADGSGFSMLFSLSNPGKVTATGSIVYYDSSGSLQPLPFSSGTNYQVSFTLPPNSTKVFTTDGSSNPVKSGYAVIQADQDSVIGIAIFRGPGFEASVLPTLPARQFAVFVERSAKIDTGISIVKLTGNTDINLTVYDAAGSNVASMVYSFSGVKDAKFLGELFKTLPTEFQGMLIMGANADFAPVGLRFGSGILSTVPVVELSGNPSITAVSPSSGTQGQTISSFTVTGNNFQPTSTLSFSGTGISVTSYSSRSAGQIIATIAIASSAATGPRNVTVTNPDTQQATSPAAFTVLPPPANQLQTERLIGTWNFLISFGGPTLPGSVTLRGPAVESSTTAGDYIVSGESGNDPAKGGYVSSLSGFRIDTSGKNVDEAYIFTFNGPTTVSGCYYNKRKTDPNFSPCFSLTGSKSP